MAVNKTMLSLIYQKSTSQAPCDAWAEDREQTRPRGVHQDDPHRRGDTLQPMGLTVRQGSACITVYKATQKYTNGLKHDMQVQHVRAKLTN